MSHTAEHATTDGAAEVRAHDRVIRYRRAGAGAVAVVLDTNGELWPELHAELAQHFRLVVPELPGDVAEASAVLGCLLDGLGGFDVALVAAARYCDAALALALGRNEFVGRVLLVPEPDGPWTDAPLAGDPRQLVETVPLCVIPRPLPAAEAVRRALRFLGARQATPSG